jgi:hypothetical protein
MHASCLENEAKLFSYSHRVLARAKFQMALVVASENLGAHVLMTYDFDEAPLAGVVCDA